ncbi:hypothetical protein BJY24_000750 [Nocardia transvalensis]|uniref:Uncharacterized protein n=1 Tax=Nocardia transvalensis TaxID=37333 RepID=A0A7W9UG42_9NOCA|nr:hypothetical protein [Nocardia transvalensis]MBB5911883.1 hypothetical protein [Nocardia transvalensis]
MRASGRWVGRLVGVAIVVGLACGSAGAGEFGPAAPPNAHLGPIGTATMHGDAEASDTTPNPGPGAGPVAARFVELGAACPTILIGADGLPQALCTSIATRSPVVYLLDPATGDPLATLPLPSGSLLGGVYGYVDAAGDFVVATGGDSITWVGHDRAVDGAWRLVARRTVSVAAAVTQPCGGAGCDAVESLVPDRDGRIWFATDHGRTGYLDPETGAVQSISLGSGEGVANSIASAAEGVAIAGDHALYLVRASESGVPQVVWSHYYDRGPARKPGQLSWGTGATPTFFGPRTGSEYVTITDNATPQENLLVYDSATGRQICSVAVLPPGPSGTENSPIGSGNSVVVASTYGYPYPAGTAGPSDPPTAGFTGGMTRVDIDPAGAGCAVRWTNSVASAAVPRLSLADGDIYTVTRNPALPGGTTTPADTFDYTVVDPATGEVRTRQRIGASAVADPLEMVGSIAPDGTQYQGATTGLFRIAAAR